MSNRYEKMSNAELIEILEMRDLPYTGKKTDLIDRLLEFDQSIRTLKSTQPDEVPDVSLIAGRFLLYNSSASGMKSTVIRMQRILDKHNSPYRLIDISRNPLMHLFWHKESNGRTLPALVKQGCIIGDLGQIRSWIDSGDLGKRVDDACEQAGVGVEDSPDLPYGPDATLGPLPKVPPEYAHLLIAQGLEIEQENS